MSIGNLTKWKNFSEKIESAVCCVLRVAYEMQDMFVLNQTYEVCVN